MGGRGAHAARCWDLNLVPLKFSAVVAPLGVPVIRTTGVGLSSETGQTERQKTLI